MSGLKRYHQGLVVGKFYPPHLGHKFLIDTALEQCDYVVVLVVENKNETIPGSIRRLWINSMCPQAASYIVKDIEDDDNSEAWAAATKAWLDVGSEPSNTAVFTSEDYGEPYAKALGISHVSVDKERKNYPISATIVRSDVLHNFNYLAPPVRGHFTKRIVFVGAESTGTTTLSKYAAAWYNTPWVPEYGRMFCEAFPSMAEIPWTHDVFAHIAQQQLAMENVIARNSNGLIMCDTNALATTLWELRYMSDGKIAIGSAPIAAGCKAELYVVTGDEIPFVQDGFRDGEEIRHEMHHQFLDMMEMLHLPFVVVRGNLHERFMQIKPLIDEIEKRKITI